jgi:signal transduction histidine kinase
MALQEADQWNLAVTAAQADASLSDKRLEMVASVVTDLRQSMASIVDYTDLLLGESIGALGALQRKFLERLKGNVDRSSQLVNELSKVAVDEKIISNSAQPDDLGGGNKS